MRTQGVLLKDKFVDNLSRVGVNAVRDRLNDVSRGFNVSIFMMVQCLVNME